MEPNTIFVRTLDFSEETEQEALYDLRWRVLRDPLGMERGTERIAEDFDADTVHFGAFDTDSRLVGCASLIPKDNGLQLRAMAVDPIWQGTGVGAAILKAAADIARETEQSLWCEARAHAVRFYERSGWAVESDVFEVPRVGPHYRMRLRSS
ncbi:MAG: GNAT family N-acetyltransferase [Armatimonadota bacterium]